MRPTKSPTIYMQQIGRALTVGNSSKRPVIIDLVDNFDSIRVVEDFTRELNGRMKDDNTKDDSKNRKFKIVDYTKNIGEISRKIEQLSRLQSLSIEEKIDLFENENLVRSTMYKTEDLVKKFTVTQFLKDIQLVNI